MTSMSSWRWPWTRVLLVVVALHTSTTLHWVVAAIFLALAVDYTQHYGVVRRESAPGRLERLRADHAWTSDHASNRSTFNLGLHADHHLRPALEYSQLANDERSLQAPLGYPGLLLLALVPPLWSRVMNLRLRD